MLTYVLLDIAVLVLLLLYVIYRKHMFDFKRMAAVFAVLFVLTAVFDSLIIHFGIVAYDTSKILGIYIGKAPIEDFAYPLSGVILIPYIWNSYAKKD